MNYLDAINALADCPETPLLKVDEVEQNKWYRMDTLKRVTTKYGKRLMVISDDFSCFLPVQYAKMDETSMNGLNLKGNLFFKVTESTKGFKQVYFSENKEYK